MVARTGHKATGCGQTNLSQRTSQDAPIEIEIERSGTSQGPDSQVILPDKRFCLFVWLTRLIAIRAGEDALSCVGSRVKHSSCPRQYHQGWAAIVIGATCWLRHVWRQRISVGSTNVVRQAGRPCSGTLADAQLGPGLVARE